MWQNNIKVIAETVIQTLKDILTYVVKVLKIFKDFIVSCIKILPDFSNGATLFKAFLNIAFYAKLITISSIAFPFPSVVLGIANEIVSMFSYGFLQFKTVASYLEEIVTESKFQAFTITKLNEEVEELRSNLRHKEIEAQQQNEVFRKQISELSTKLSREQDLKTVILTENQELLQQLKSSKLVTQIDNANKWGTILTTTVLICKEVYRYFNPLPSDHENLAEILKVARVFQNRLSRFDMQQTANAREQGVNRGLSNEPVSLDDIDNAN